MKFRYLVALFVGISLSFTSHSYGWQTCEGHKLKWKNERVTLKISTESFPEGSWARTVLNRSISKINGISDFRYGAEEYTGTVYYGGGDAHDNVYFSSSLPSGKLGLNKKRWRCTKWPNGHVSRHYQESDILMNSNVLWTSGVERNLNYWLNPSKIRTDEKPVYNLEVVLQHELLHGLGLNHSESHIGIMSPSYPHNGPQGRAVYPHQDDVNGARYLYGTNERNVTYTDVASFGIQNVRKSDGTYEQKALDGTRGSTRYRESGESISLKLGIQNLGTVPPKGSVKIQWYLSSNSFISTSDTRLGGYISYSNFGGWGNAEVTRTIPTNTRPGTYYVGFIIDPWNEIDEEYEDNNTMVAFKLIVDDDD